MKKIIIVNNNMKIGGVQKSLYNLLWSIDTVDEYDVTLLLFSKTGDYVDILPESVRVKECKGLFRYLGKGQGEFKGNLADFLLRAVFAVISRVISGNFAINLLLFGEPKLKEEYDFAISFLHNGQKNAFYGGTQNYVLKKIKAKKKIAFIHGDYCSCGANHSENNKMLEKFDLIVACSDGCRKILTRAVPSVEDKCVTVRNFNRFDEIRSMACEDPTEYDSSVTNVIMVARLSHTKGIDRAIKAISYCIKKDHKVMLHIVGGGSLQGALQELAKDEGVEKNVIFYGEQSNPYRYMKNADLLLMASYHEAAPMVIDEAGCLCLPVLSTRTTSTDEMITDVDSGWVCENSQEALNEALDAILSDKNALAKLKNELTARQTDNSTAQKQFEKIIRI